MFLSVQHNWAWDLNIITKNCTWILNYITSIKVRGKLSNPSRYVFFIFHTAHVFVTCHNITHIICYIRRICIVVIVLQKLWNSNRWSILWPDVSLRKPLSHTTSRTLLSSIPRATWTCSAGWNTSRLGTGTAAKDPSDTMHCRVITFYIPYFVWTVPIVYSCYL